MKNIVGLAAALVYSSVSFGETATLEVLKARCDEAQKYSQHTPFNSTFTCVKTGELMAQGKQEFRLKNSGQSGFRVAVKANETPWLLHTEDVDANVGQCPTFQKVTYTVRASESLSCAKLKEINNEAEYCANALASKVAACEEAVATGGVPFNADQGFCNFKVDPTIQSCMGDTSSRSSVSTISSTASNSGTTVSESSQSSASNTTAEGAAANSQTSGTSESTPSTATYQKVENATGTSDTSQDSVSSTEAASKAQIAQAGEFAGELGAQVIAVRSPAVESMGLFERPCIKVTTTPTPGSPLARMGAQEGSLIWEINGKRVRTPADLVNAIRAAAASPKAKANGVVVKIKNPQGNWQSPIVKISG